MAALSLSACGSDSEDESTDVSAEADTISDAGGGTTPDATPSDVTETDDVPDAIDLDANADSGEDADGQPDAATDTGQPDTDAADPPDVADDATEDASSDTPSDAVDDGDVAPDTGEDGGTDTSVEPADVARIEIDQPGAVLEASGEDVSLTAIAYSADGAVVVAELDWELSATDAFLDLGAGRFSATDVLGSAQVWAFADGVRSAPVTLVNARVATEVARYEDATFVETSVLNEVDANGGVMTARFAPGTEFAVGEIIVGSGAAGVVGRVVSTIETAEGVEVTLAPVALADMLTDYSLTGSVDLGALAQAADGASDEKSLSVRCTSGVDDVEVTLGDAELSNTSTITEWPTAVWSMDTDLVEVRLQGRLGIDIGASVSLALAPEIAWECTIEMYALPLPVLPLPWSLGFALEAPVGLRVDLEASASAADVEAGANGLTSIDLDLGFRCEADLPCVVYQDVAVAPVVWEPSLRWSTPLAVEATVFAGGFVGLWGGVPLPGVDRADRPGAMLGMARAGTRLTITKAGRDEQFDSSELAAAVSVETGTAGSIGISGDVIEDILGWSIELLSVEDWEDWLSTPTGTLNLTHVTPGCGAADAPVLDAGCPLEARVEWGASDISAVSDWGLYQQTEAGWVLVAESGASEWILWTPTSADEAAGSAVFAAAYRHAWLPGAEAVLEVAEDSLVSVTAEVRVDACVNAADSAIIASSASTVSSEAQDCGFGCLGAADASLCTAQCVSAATGLSQSCARCYGDRVQCGFSTCLVPCAVDPSSSACTSCQATNCTGPFDECTGL